MEEFLATVSPPCPEHGVADCLDEPAESNVELTCYRSMHTRT